MPRLLTIMLGAIALIVAIVGIRSLMPGGDNIRDVQADKIPTLDKALPDASQGRNGMPVVVIRSQAVERPLFLSVGGRTEARILDVKSQSAGTVTQAPVTEGMLVEKDALLCGLDVDGASAKVAYMILCWPVSDPPARYRYAIANKMDIHIQSHERYWPSEAMMAEGSPQRLVAAGEAAVLPPALLIQGTNDTILSPGMSERFAETYAAAGGDMTLIHYPGEKHTFITNTPDTPASQTALADMIAFIRRQTTARPGG